MTDSLTPVVGKNWKTYAGAIGIMLSAIAGGILNYTEPQDVGALTLIAAAMKFFSGLTALGIGHKLQRLLLAFCATLPK